MRTKKSETVRPATDFISNHSGRHCRKATGDHQEGNHQQQQQQQQQHQYTKEKGGSERKKESMKGENSH